MKSHCEKQAVFMTMLRSSVCRKHVESLFLYRASPVLRKAKPAVLLTVRAECVAVWKRRERAMRKASGLSVKKMTNKNGSALFLIYDRAALEQSVRNEKAASILAGFGYNADDSMDALLNHLSARLCAEEFPHEIGVFLGYPPGDVKAYIDNNGKNCTCCRYWKAYEDVETAQKIWARIDEAQSYAIDVLQGFPPIHIAASLLKAVS